MLFNSIEFAIFLPLVFAAYWFLFSKHLRIQNIFVVAAGYLFYGWWDPRFLSLIVISSLVDYFTGVALEKTSPSRRRKKLLAVSIVTNIGFLSVFKYFDFFAASFSDAFTLLGHPINVRSLNIALPVGISFYTFQTMSYSIDVYRGRLKPIRDIWAFFAFVSFFPQLVAGPIERATNLLPQFTKSRVFDYEAAADGMRQILLGMFKKVVIADTLARVVEKTFSDYATLSGSTLWLGAVCFSFQIYCDFSGYSDIAIGTSRLFGFSLQRNFANPYFSRDIGEFWRRWHISLTTWFRDYLYIPLGGSRGSTIQVIRNTFIVFTVSGLWHGANWTFVAWGFFNALLFIPLMLRKKNRDHLDTPASGHLLPTAIELAQMTWTFLLVTVGWVLFRAESISHAGQYLLRMFSASVLSLPEIVKDNEIVMLLPIGFLLLLEWFGREKAHAMAVEHLRPVQRRGLYAILFMFIFFLGDFGETQFIYFQF